MMNLNRYTKEDLVWIIKQMADICESAGNSLKIVVERLEIEKENNLLNEAERWKQISDDAWKQYCKLICGYACPDDIPTDKKMQMLELLKTSKMAERERARILLKATSY